MSEMGGSYKPVNDNDIDRNGSIMKPPRGRQEILLRRISVLRVPVPRIRHLARMSDSIHVPDARERRETQREKIDRLTQRERERERESVCAR